MMATDCIKRDVCVMQGTTFMEKICIGCGHYVKEGVQTQTTNSSSIKLADDIECAKQWLLPQRPVTQVEVDACIKELDIVISQLRT
jgi:hypothetical protein